MEKVSVLRKIKKPAALICVFALLLALFPTSAMADTEGWRQLPLYGGDVNALTYAGTNLYAGTHGGVYRSADQGDTWTQVNNGLTNTYVNALTYAGTNLYAGTYGGGVYRSADQGDTWTQVNNGLTNTDVRALTYAGTNLYAGTYYGGVYMLMTYKAPTVGNITAPDAVNTGGKLDLTTPIVEDNNAAVTAQGWQISANGSTGWQDFDPNTPMTVEHNGQYLRYYASNREGTGYSPNTVQLAVEVTALTPDGDGSVGTTPTPGDPAMPDIWLLALLASAACMGGVLLLRKRAKAK